MSEKCIICNSNCVKFTSGYDYNMGIEKNKQSIVKCIECGVEKLQKVPTRNLQKSYYGDGYYSFNIKKRNRIAFLFSWVDTIFKKIKGVMGKNATNLKEIIGGNNHLNFLDVGCGDGVLESIIQKKGRIYIGFEIGKQKKIGNIWYNSDLTKEFFLDKKFDLILLSHTFEHMDNPINILDHLKKLLNKEGKIQIIVPTVDGISSKVYMQYAVERDIPRHIFNYTKEGLDMLFDNHNFNFQSKYLSQYGTLSSLQWYLHWNTGKEFKFIFRVFRLFPVLDILLSFFKKTNQIEYILESKSK